MSEKLDFLKDVTTIENCMIPKDITSIKIPSNIIEIDNKAFANCRNLTEVDLNDCVNLEYLGHRAFMNCVNLTKIDFSKCNNLKFVGEFCFDGCKKLKHAILPRKDKNEIRISDYVYTNSGILNNTKYVQNKLKEWV